MVRELQAVIGQEAKQQLAACGVERPDAVVACVGGGSNAMGIFQAFIDDPAVKLFGVEAAGHGLDSGAHAAAIHGGQVGVLHGQKSYLLQDDAGQVLPAHSISAGLDYPGVGPEHAWLHDSGRATYLAVTDDEALAATLQLARLEGILPALETAHALAALPEIVERVGRDTEILVNLSGRGDKDMETLAPLLEDA
jgi:tryptophan synthase beta chain